VKSGFIELKGGDIAGGEVVIDMNSITDADLTDPNYNQKLVGHLKSEDFFGVEKHPTSKFTITKAGKLKDGKTTVTGTLTIKGKTETITFDVIKKDNTFSAKIDVDRSKFDVRYGSKSFFDNLGDKVIDDIFVLDIKLSL
jgi:polyisoprenoid-binding protein YceI